MITLGLHFGHDANMALVEGGQLRGYYEKERHVRVRHAGGLTSDEIVSFLSSHGLSMDKVDHCVITSTQFLPIYMWDDRLDIAIKPPARIDAHPRQPFTIPLSDNYKKFTAWTTQPPSLYCWFSDSFPCMPDGKPYESSLAAIATQTKYINIREAQFQDITLSLDGKSPKQACYISHHLSHAQYALSFGPFARPLIISYDGMAASDFAGGGIYFGRDGKACPAVPHGFWCGSFYDGVASIIGLGRIGGAGKLMGLAAYGQPVYARRDFCGTFDEMQKFSTFKSGEDIAIFWLQEILRAEKLTAATLPAWDGKSNPPKFQADIASSAQAIFSQNVVATVDAAVAYAKRNGLDFDGIALSGGCALNCPANSLIAAKHGPVFVPPAVNDEGLAIGSALSFASDWKKPALSPFIAYLGNEYAASPASVADLVPLAEGDAAIALLAQKLHAGKVAGFYYGNAEIGPRALGHRSILASPLLKENHEKVNLIKNREQWRPLAPIATEQHYRDYFTDLPPDSYFMLMNARVTTKQLPAITHKDGTARVQIATPECGPVYDLLLAFGKLSGHYVLLNTSFNGKLEPIVETPEHAINAFKAMPLDVLYMNGALFEKRGAVKP